MQSYLNLLRHVLTNGEHHTDRTGITTTSVFGYQIRHNMHAGFPLLTTKKVHFKSIFHELIWFLSGGTMNQELIARGVTIWNEWADFDHTSKFGREEGDLGPVYGWQWRRFGQQYPKWVDGQHGLSPLPMVRNGFDQIDWVLKEIVKNPNSRRLIVTAWHPRQANEVELPPCHSFFQFKCHESDNSISLHFYMRSCDAFLGLPFNIASYALLLEMVATVTGRHAKELVVSFGDLHIYKNHLPQVYTQLNRKPTSLPELIFIHGASVYDQTETMVNRLTRLQFDDVSIIGYNPHPAIKAEVAV